MKLVHCDILIWGNHLFIYSWLISRLSSSLYLCLCDCLVCLLIDFWMRLVLIFFKLKFFYWPAQSCHFTHGLHVFQSRVHLFDLLYLLGHYILLYFFFYLLRRSLSMLWQSGRSCPNFLNILHFLRWNLIVLIDFVLFFFFQAKFLLLNSDLFLCLNLRYNLFVLLNWSWICDLQLVFILAYLWSLLCLLRHKIIFLKWI